MPRKCLFSPGATLVIPLLLSSLVPALKLTELSSDGAWLKVTWDVSLPSAFMILFSCGARAGGLQKLVQPEETELKILLTSLSVPDGTSCSVEALNSSNGTSLDMNTFTWSTGVWSTALTSISTTSSLGDPTPPSQPILTTDPFQPSNQGASLSQDAGSSTGTSESLPDMLPSETPLSDQGSLMTSSSTSTPQSNTFSNTLPTLTTSGLSNTGDSDQSQPTHLSTSSASMSTSPIVSGSASASPTPLTTSHATSHAKSLPIGAIIGETLGSILILLILACLVVIYRRRRRPRLQDGWEGRTLRESIRNDDKDINMGTDADLDMSPLGYSPDEKACQTQQYSYTTVEDSKDALMMHWDGYTHVDDGTSISESFSGKSISSRPEESPWESGDTFVESSRSVSVIGDIREMDVAEQRRRHEQLLTRMRKILDRPWRRGGYL